MKEGQPTSHFLIDPYALAGNRFVWLVVVVVRFIAILFCWHGINTLGLFNLQPWTLHIEFAGSPVILHTIGIYRKNEYWIASQKVCGESKSDYRKAPLSTVYGIFRCCHCGVRDLKVCQYLGCFFREHPSMEPGEMSCQRLVLLMGVYCLIVPLGPSIQNKLNFIQKKQICLPTSFVHHTLPSICFMRCSSWW